jgi:hypothetical protein
MMIRVRKEDLMAEQTNWRWCRKCEVLYSYQSAQGGCPAGGYHASQGSGHYILTFNVQQGWTETGWRRCRFCQCMFHERSSSLSSSIYAPAPPVLPPRSDVALPPWLRTETQPPAHAPTLEVVLRSLRECPAVGDGSGRHDGSASEDFVVTQGDASDPFQTGWRRCRKCQCLFYAAGDRAWGVCARDREPHEDAGSGYSVSVERHARLPYPFAAMQGRNVDFKTDTRTSMGWVTLSACEWKIASEKQLLLSSKWGQSLFLELNLLMVHGPACLVSITVGGSWSFDIGDWNLRQLTIPGTQSRVTIPCWNSDATQDPEAEWAANRSNGLTLNLLGLGRLFPKASDRIRIALVLPLPGFPPGITDFELDTHE